MPLQAFVDEYDDLTVEEWNALDPPPDVDAAQEAVFEIAQDAVDRGCDVATMETGLAAAIEEIRGENEVGRAIAAALRGDGQLQGPPAPGVATTVPRDQVPTTVTVEPGDGIADVLAQVAPGSTIRFAPGTHRFTEPIVVDMDLHFEGAGIDETILSSNAEGVALAFVGPGGFTVADMTIEHTGAAEASVFLAIEGPVAIDSTRLRGGTAGTDAAGGGHGIVFAYEPLDGFPERTSIQRAGALSVTNSEVVDNAAAGVLITGDAAPDLDGVVIARNGGCGLCYTSTAAGSATATTIDGNDIGVQIADASSPELREVRVIRSTSAGVSIDGTATPSIIESAIEENGNIGLQVAGEAEPVVERNTVRQHGVGILVAGSGTFELVENAVVGHEIGIQVGGSATVDTIDSTIWLSTTAAVSYSEQSSGTVTGSQIDRAPDVGIQAIDSAAIDVIDNLIENEGGVGISFVDESTGNADANTITDREVGVQVGGTATPSIFDNDITGSVAVGVLFGDAAGGRASGNRISSPEAVGILAGGTSSPRIEANSVTRNGVGLVFREATTATAIENTVDEHAVGVQVVDESTPQLVGNTIVNSLEAGVVYGGSAGGLFDDNVLETNGNISLQVGESATPRILANRLTGEGVYGALYRDAAGGEFRGNIVDNFVFGVQLNDDAAPGIFDNALEQIALTNVVYADRTGGEISGNACTQSFSAGISVAADATPTVGTNSCTVSRGG